MNKTKAIEILVKHNFHFRRAYVQLISWDDRLTAKELSIVLGVPHERIHSMARTYGIKYKPDTIGAPKK